MFNFQIQQAELVRLLQEKAYIFSADPKPITDFLRHEKGTVTEKIIRRAQMIDNNQTLANRLTKINHWLYLSWWLIAVLSFIGGVAAILSVMHSNQVNFFGVLFSVLGLNTLMLCIWLFSIFRSQNIIINFVFKFIGRIHKKNLIDQTIIELYMQEISSPAMRWWVGRMNHIFWIASLSGMLVAILFLLLVRQYYFFWESTLLSDQDMAFLISMLFWLPVNMGLSMPDVQLLTEGRMIVSWDDAKGWAILLLFSILIYGIMPRFLAFIVCHMQYKFRSKLLPLNNHYYQKLINDWNKKVVDEDVVGKKTAHLISSVRLSNAQKWVCVLDAPWSNQNWHRNMLGQNWIDKGAIIDRGAMESLLAALNDQAIQLLVGVRAQVVPDRGVLRYLERLTQAAQGGLFVQLLAEDEIDLNFLKQTLEQWHEALAERGIACFDPPHIAQANIVTTV